MAYTPNGVVSHGFPIDDVTFTYELTGQAQTDAAAASAAGKAVTQDKTKPAAVKLAGDGDILFGRVFQAENRSVQGFMTAAVQRMFKEKLPAAVGHGIALGDSVVGGAAVNGQLGYVKKATEANRTLVVEVGTDFVVVELI